MTIGRQLKRSKKGKRAQGKRRRNGGGTRRTRAGTVLNTSTIGFPDRITTRLRVSVDQFLDDGGAALFVTKQSTVTRADQIFGRSCKLFATYASLYDQYMVWGMKYNLIVANNSTGLARYALQFSDSLTPETNLDDIYERPYVQKDTVSIGGAAVKHHSSYVSRKKICNLKMLHTVNTPYTNFSGSDADEGKVALHISMHSVTSTNLRVFGTIDLWVTFFNQKQQPAA